MKVQIIGGGVAGFATCLALRQSGLEATVFEQAPKISEVGLGFILMGNGMECLTRLGLDHQVRKAGVPLYEAVMRWNTGKEIRVYPLEDAFGLTRTSFLQILIDACPDKSIILGKELSHLGFSRSDFSVQKAFFRDGTDIDGDIFIAADGARSRVRQMLFPESQLSSVRVKELVNMVKCPRVHERLKGRFVKTMDPNGGLAIGVVPADNDYVIWYIQYDSKKWDVDGVDAEAKESFAMEYVKTWPEPIPTLIRNTKFERSHIWHTADLDPLPQLHHQNTLLIGDAAHAFLTFTSQGVSSALKDAVMISDFLKRLEGEKQWIPSIFDEFSRKRRSEIKSYVNIGRGLAHRFLSEQDQDSVDVPLAK